MHIPERQLDGSEVRYSHAHGLCWKHCHHQQAPSHYLLLLFLCVIRMLSVRATVALVWKGCTLAPGSRALSCTAVNMHKVLVAAVGKCGPCYPGSTLRRRSRGVSILWLPRGLSAGKGAEERTGCLLANSGLSLLESWVPVGKSHWMLWTAGWGQSGNFEWRNAVQGQEALPV